MKLGLERDSLDLTDYGAPTGFRPATRRRCTHGVRAIEAISPDDWNIDRCPLDRPGHQEIQLQLFYDDGSNPPRSSSNSEATGSLVLLPWVARSGAAGIVVP